MCLEVRDNCGNWFSSSTMTLGIRVRLLDWQQHLHLLSHLTSLSGVYCPLVPYGW